MSQYQEGSVNVTSGSNVVTGNGTLWDTNNAVLVGDAFKVEGFQTTYEVASVDSDTQITLVSNYGEATETYQPYQITRDFTTNYSFREINKGDKDWPFHYTHAIRAIDTQMKLLADRIKTKATTTTTTTSSSTSSTISTTSSTSSTLSTTSSTSSTISTSSTSSTISTTSSTSSTISTTSTLSTTTTPPP